MTVHFQICYSADGASEGTPWEVVLRASSGTKQTIYVSKVRLLRGAEFIYHPEADNITEPRATAEGVALNYAVEDSTLVLW